MIDISIYISDQNGYPSLMSAWQMSMHHGSLSTRSILNIYLVHTAQSAPSVATMTVFVKKKSYGRFNIY